MANPGSGSAYSFSLTTFSPSGKSVVAELTHGVIIRGLSTSPSINGDRERGVETALSSASVRQLRTTKTERGSPVYTVPQASLDRLSTPSQHARPVSALACCLWRNLTLPSRPD